VVVIGQTVFVKLFKDQNAIGKRILSAINFIQLLVYLLKSGLLQELMQITSLAIPVETASVQYGTTSVSRIDIAANNPDLLPIVLRQINQTLLKKIDF